MFHVSEFPASFSFSCDPSLPPQWRKEVPLIYDQHSISSVSAMFLLSVQCPTTKGHIHYGLHYILPSNSVKLLNFAIISLYFFFLNWNAFPNAECYGWILAALAKWFWNHVDIYKIFVKFLNWKQQRWALSRCWLKGMMKTVILQQKDFWQVQIPPRKIFPRLHLVFSTFMDTGAECDR